MGKDRATYNTETSTWSPSETRYADTARYILNSNSIQPTQTQTVGELIVPKDAFWKVDEHPGELFYPEPQKTNRNDVSETGYAYRVTFDIQTPPKKFEEYVYAVSWDDENTNSPRANTVISNSLPVVRTGEDEYIHARTHNGDDTISVNWGDRYIRDGDKRDHTFDSVYQTLTGRDTDGDMVYVSRLSGFGRFTPKLYEGGSFEDVNDVRFISSDWPENFNADLQFPWGVSVEVPISVRNDAEEVAARNSGVHGGNLGRVHGYVNSSEVTDHPIIQDVASQLGDVCDAMGATHPIEQVRVVADFVQYMNHTASDLASGQEGVGEGRVLAPGTAPPVTTLGRGYGDCKDFTVLMNSLIQQDPFNMNPSVAYLPDVAVYNADSIGHVTTAISESDLEVDHVPRSDMVDTTTAMHERFFIDGEMHWYIETSTPFQLGYVEQSWARNNTVTSLEREL